MRSSRLVMGVLCVVAFILPYASAMDAEGTLVSRGELRFTGQTHVETGDPLAILHPDVAGIEDMEIIAPLVKLHVFEATSIGLPSAAIFEIDKVERSWSLTNASIRATASEDWGFTGIYPHLGGRMDIASSGPMSATPREYSRVAVSTGTEDAPRFPYYLVEVAQPHLHMEGAGTLTYHGAGAIKIRGLDLLVESDQNVTRISTGHEETSTATIVYRWVYVTFGEDAQIVIDSPASPFEIAVGRASSLAWDGLARFQAESGALEAAGTRFHVADPHALTLLEGRFHGHIEPSPDSADRALLHVSGDLRSTNLAASSLPLAPVAGGAWAPTIFAMAVAVGTGSTAAVSYYASKRVGAWWRDRKENFTLSECLHYAEVSEKAQEYETAVAWYDKALKRAPDDWGILLDKAGIYHKIQQHDMALKMLEQAEAASIDGLPAFESARILTSIDRLDEADASLERALRLSPDMVLTLHAQVHDFAPLAGRPRAEQAIDKAERHLARSRLR